MKVIRISEEVWEILKLFAKPLEDNPDSVLKRILDEYIELKNKLSHRVKETPSVKGEHDMESALFTRESTRKKVTGLDKTLSHMPG